MSFIIDLFHKYNMNEHSQSCSDENCEHCGGKYRLIINVEVLKLLIQNVYGTKAQMFIDIINKYIDYDLSEVDELQDKINSCYNGHYGIMDKYLTREMKKDIIVESLQYSFK